MNILCPIKQVPDSLEVNVGKDFTLEREYVAQVLNKADESAVELALQLRDEFGGQVTAFTMGPLKAEGTLRELLSRGVDHAALLSSSKCAGSDTLATARALAAIVQTMQPYDMVLFGRRASDGETGQVGPMTSALLGIPCVANVVSAKVKNEYVNVDQLTEDGLVHWKAKMPIALTLCEWSYTLRLPTLESLRNARNARIPHLTPESIGVDPSMVGLKGSPTRVVRVNARSVGVRSVHWLTIQEAAERIAKLKVKNENSSLL